MGLPTGAPVALLHSIKKTYIKHVKQIHNGIALPKSILNRPPWVDYVFFYSDEVEELYAGVDAEPT